MSSDPRTLRPDDRHNRLLRELVAPEDWTNPKPADRYDLVVIGGGTAGLVAAIGAAGLGATVALVEGGMMGGDCLNWGCVPSKALIRCALAAHEARRAAEFGVQTGEVSVDFGAVMARMRRLRTGIAHHDSFERVQGEGVHAFRGMARFVGRRRLKVGETELSFHRALVATGGKPVLPPVAGIDEVRALTNETVFQLTERPARLLVVGAGPIGCELAQAFQRLGSQVSLVDMAHRVLTEDDPEASELVAETLVAEGVNLHLGVGLRRLERTEAGEQRALLDPGESDAPEQIPFDAVLLATGRRPHTEGLGLEEAGVRTREDGAVETDAQLRTSNPRIYAAGDVTGRWQFTHAADAMARVVLRNALFFGSESVDDLVIPWCTYTDPEVAQVGLSWAAVQERGDLDLYRAELADVDRAKLDGDTAGWAKLYVDRGGHIVSATLVGRHAGEHLGEVALAVTNGVKIGQLDQTVHPYPTRAEVLRRAAGAWSKARLSPAASTVLSGIIKLRRL